MENVQQDFLTNDKQRQLPQKIPIISKITKLYKNQ